MRVHCIFIKACVTESIYHIADKKKFIKWNNNFFTKQNPPSVINKTNMAITSRSANDEQHIKSIMLFKSL